MYYVLTTHKFDLNTKKGSTALSVQDNTETVEITTTNESLFLFYFYVLLCSFLYFFLYTYINTMCSSITEKSLQSACLDRKGDNGYRIFLGRYIHVHVLVYSSCSLGAIEPNMATKHFYDFMSVLRAK